MGRSKRDTIRGVQSRIGDIYIIYVYIEETSYTRTDLNILSFLGGGGGM